SDLSDNEEEKIVMLTTALDASRNYLGHAIESRTGIIVAKMRLGLLYEELSMLNQNIDTLMEGRDIFLQVIKECQERGYRSYMAATYEYIARLEDRMGNFSASAKYYENAQDAYADTLENIEYGLLRKRVNEKMNYAKAWSLIETAKAHHKKENHLEAKENYNNASEILNNVSGYNYEAPYYAAWSLLEEAEQISKQDRQEDAIERYQATRTAFENTFDILANTFKETKEKIEREKVEKLKKVAKLRMNYCSARIDLETARILGKQGEHLEAAEKFASAASQFRHVCTRYKIERERKELEAVYYLCRAWESMELAEKYEEPERFTEAANLFTKASNLFTDSKLKLLSSGNSTFCQALEYGCKFDDSIEMETKSQLYTEVKSLLRKAADLYRKGGFDSGSDWALATSTYFDATWHLIRADKELDINKKGDILGIGSRYLKSAAELFSTAGHKDKVIDVQKQLEMVEREEIIILSALNTVKRPAISSSTMGIIAPACPIESSQSPRMSEIQQINEESRRVLIKRAERPIEIYECETNLNILHLSDIQEGRFGIKEDISKVKEAYFTFLSDLKDKLEIIHRKNKIDFIVISGDLTSTASKEEFYYLTNEFLPILNEVFLEGKNPVPKNRWIIVPGNHDVEWERASARFNNFIEFCQENGFHQYNLNDPESI
ncbi:MAG: metallophosphoesterase, partial [Promethearchaeota archaeon]